MTTITTPASLDAAVAELTSLGELVTATEWHRAAILAAHVRLDEGNGGREVASSSHFISARAFAALGIVGLRSKDTISRYVRAWLDAHEGRYPARGRAVKLPTTPWPPEDKNIGTRMPADPARAIEKLVEEHGSSAIADVVVADDELRPAVLHEAPAVEVAAEAHRSEVARAIVEDNEAYLEVIRAAGEKRREEGAEFVRQLTHEPFAKVLAHLHLDRLAIEATAMHRVVVHEFIGEYTWRPGERERVLAEIDAARQLLDDVRTVLVTDVSDEALAGLLDE